MRTARIRLEVMSALLALAASVWAVCPCVPPAAAASGEHSCCPAGDEPVMSAPRTDCCSDHSLGSTTAATAGAISAPAVGIAGAACLPPAARVVASRLPVVLPFVPHPPLVLRI